MLTKHNAEPLPDRVRSSHQKLFAAATELNSASDRFAKLVAQIDETLRPLNIGVTSWVQIGLPHGDEHTTTTEYVGYAKVNGKWGIALSTVEEYHDGRDGSENSQLWTFSDGPRRLRLEAVDYLPNLLDELAMEAVGETQTVARRTGELEQFVSALKIGGKQ